MKPLASLVCFFWSIPSVFGSCVTYDMSTWPQNERNHLASVTYRLLFEAGENIVPTLTGDTVCFENSVSDLNTVLSVQVVRDRFQADELVRAQLTQQEQQRQADFETEITTNTFCTAELTELDTRIDAAVDAAPNTVAGIKTLLKSALKKVSRCVRARAR